MIHYAEYDAYGKYIVKNSTWSMDGVEASNGGFIYFGEVDPLTQYHDVVINAPVALPERPSPNHRFDYAKKQWIDPRTLNDIKLAKWAIIKQARSSAEFGGFTWDGSPFDSDAISQSRIQGAVQLAAMAPGFTIDWTLANNSVRNLSAADLANVGAALGMHVATQHAKARTLRSQIEAATTPAEVEAVTW